MCAQRTARREIGIASVLDHGNTLQAMTIVSWNNGI
jgi:hypothetical protein